MTAPGYKIFSDFQKNYIGFPYSPQIAELGVDINTIEYAKRQLEGELNSNSLTWRGKDAFEKLENIK